MMLKQQFLNTFFISFLLGINACSTVDKTDKAQPSGLTALECSGTEHYQPLREPPSITAVNKIQTDLSARSVYKCVNGKAIKLQSYIDTQAGTDNRPIGPAYILHVNAKKPGPILRIKLSNQLGDSNKTYDCGHHGKDIKVCTNLHTHGFHVSPKGSDDPSVVQSDYVFIKITPATPPVQYQYDIPADHAPGTHWMHAHLHGSTAPQVKNGMAGALILKGELDKTLATEYGIRGEKDKIMLLTQMSTDEDPVPCGKDENGDDITTAINGQCLPSITIRAGDVQRWRFIHAGVSETIHLALKFSDGRKQTLNEFARDGITLNGIQRQKNITLQPGYRSDVLVQFTPEQCHSFPCELYLIDDASEARSSLLGIAESYKKIAKIIIIANNKTTMRMPPSSVFTNPYPWICEPSDFESCSKRLQEKIVQFATLDNDSGGADFTVNNYVYPDTPVGTPIGPPVQQLRLNNKNTWKLWVGEKQTSVASHPFHIHVNPFQLIDEKGFSYWKDTLLVSVDKNKGRENALTVLSHYEDFDGRFVLHCHNLNHEDKGMMMDVVITK
ncbi:Laccase [hydrothermal vent metagenome]|uniref:Laccase n=1 Tax=hydrothermal vent metagenome TaxID=652676 RepID=A0A3B0WUM1_9ZZZZ